MLSRTGARLVHRVGRRGAFLLFLFILNMVYAWALHQEVAPQTAALLSPEAWSWAWFGVGVVCGISAFTRRDRVAYTLAAALLCGWAGVSAYQWVEGKLPEGWLSTVVWLAFSGTVLIVSSWPEAVEIRKIIDPPDPQIRGSG